MNRGWTSLAAVCTLVIGIYAYTAHLSDMELLFPNAADASYNLLAQGFRAGQLSLKKEVPPGFAQLADPYDPIANAPYRSAPYFLNDLSYYKGRLYLYFGVTPALLLFWPVVALTGHYLFPQQAAVIFCALGFLVSVGLLRALWRRYFAEVNVAVVSACALALGIATGLPVLLLNSGAYEAAIGCAYMLTMLALAAIWCALHEPQRRCQWLAAAGVAYGLAVGARPNLVFGAAILLVPVALAWRERLVASIHHERQQRWAVLLAAIVPIGLVGLGLMLYNARRFDNPFEWGWHCQLGGVPQVTEPGFSLRYLWFNFRVYFLAPAHWSAHFPFVHDITMPPLPPGHLRAERPFGILTNIPLAWLALAAPLAWRRRSPESGATLRAFVIAVALLFVICALTLGVFFGSTFRYEVDFLPALLLLAVVGILGWERALAPTSEPGQADRRLSRRAVRCGWLLLLVFSVAFNLLANVDRYTETHFNVACSLVQVGRIQEGIGQFEQALRFNPDHADVQYNLGNALLASGDTPGAINHWRQATLLKPDYADAHNDLGVALAQSGKFPEAIEHFNQALQVTPGDPQIHYNLGSALAQTGNFAGAIDQFEQVLRLNPDFIEARNNLTRLRGAH